MAEQALLDRLKRYSKKCLTERTDGDFADAVWEAVEVIDGLLNDLQDALDTIEELTDRNVGKWEVLESFSSPFDDSHKDRCRCTNCGFIHVFTDYHFGQYNFCPNCGAKMDGE